MLTAGASIVAMTAVLAASRGAFGDAAARVVFLVAAWLLGDSIRSRRAYVHEIEQKAERLERERAARFPGTRGRIPNFRGAEAAASRLASLPEQNHRLAAQNPVFVLWGSL